MPEFSLSSKVDNNKIFLIKRSELEGRLDCGYYLPALKDNIDRIKGQPHFRLRDKINELQTGYNNNQNYLTGLPFLRTQNVRPIWLDTTNTTFTDDVSIRVSKYGDLLFTRIGVNVGDVGFNNLGDLAISDNVILARLCNIELAKFCAIFLVTNIGKLFIEREKRDTARAIISYENIKKILIPDLHSKTRLSIIKKVDTAYTAKKQKETEAQRLLNSIDDYLLSELGIELPKQKENTIQSRMFTRQLSEISGGRFDPYPYQKIFLQLDKALESLDTPVKKLKKIVNFLDYGLMPTQDYAFSEYDGLPMIRVTNIKTDGSIDMKNTKYIKYDTPRLYKKLVKSNDILMVQCGNTTGKCALVPKEYEGYTFGSFSFVIRGNSEIVLQEYLFNILSSVVVQEQLDRNMTINSVRPNTAKPEVLNFKIPLPPLSKQTAIATHITELRTQAKHLQHQAQADLEQAKREVEAMILGGDASKA